MDQFLVWLSSNGSVCLDLEEIKAFAKESGASEANEINYWDIDFWSERLREAKYDINEVLFFFFQNVTCNCFDKILGYIEASVNF